MCHEQRCAIPSICATAGRQFRCAARRATSTWEEPHLALDTEGEGRVADGDDPRRQWRGVRHASGLRGEDVGATRDETDTWERGGWRIENEGLESDGRDGLLTG